MGHFKKDPCLLHGGNAYHPGRGEVKCLRMSKGEGRHVDKSLLKRLHIAKCHCSQMYGPRDLSSKMFVNLNQQ